MSMEQQLYDLQALIDESLENKSSTNEDISPEETVTERQETLYGKAIELQETLGVTTEDYITLKDRSAYLDALAVQTKAERDKAERRKTEIERQAALAAETLAEIERKKRLAQRNLDKIQELNEEAVDVRDMLAEEDEGKGADMMPIIGMAALGIICIVGLLAAMGLMMR